MADAAPAKLRKSWARLRCLVIANSLLRLRTMGRGRGSIGSHAPPRQFRRVAIRLIDLRHPLRPKAASRAWAEKLILPSGSKPSGISSIHSQIFCFRFSELCAYLHAIPRSQGGALRDRHERGRRDAMDVSARQTSACDADGKGVWSWCPDAGIKSGVTNPRATEAIKPGTPGRARNKP